MRRSDSSRRAARPQRGEKNQTVFRDEARYKCVRMMCSGPDKPRISATQLVRFRERCRDPPGIPRFSCTNVHTHSSVTPSQTFSHSTSHALVCASASSPPPPPPPPRPCFTAVCSRCGSPTLAPRARRPPRDQSHTQRASARQHSIPDAIPAWSESLSHAGGRNVPSHYRHSKKIILSASS